MECISRELEADHGLLKTHQPDKLMKLIRILAVALAASSLTLTAVSCREKGPAEKVGDKIDDALDARPGEPVRDAVEKVTE